MENIDKKAVKKAYKEVSSKEKHRIHGGSPLARLINMQKTQGSKRFWKQDYNGPEKPRDIKAKVLAMAKKMK